MSSKASDLRLMVIYADALISDAEICCYVGWDTIRGVENTRPGARIVSRIFGDFYDGKSDG